ncbi:MAG: hypothetical protein PWQ59_1740 [Thermoanaerobacterium sp.]|nr:hypothetical protein [Thermoanaerobacterium sp.]
MKLNFSKNEANCMKKRNKDFFNPFYNRTWHRYVALTIVIVMIVALIAAFSLPMLNF